MEHSEITIQFLSCGDVTSQDGVLIRAAPLDGFLAPIVLCRNRNTIPMQADRSR